MESRTDRASVFDLIHRLQVCSSADPFEQYGLHLVNTAIARLRMSTVKLPWCPVPPEGPHFLYEAAPNLFPGRRGRGPLHVAWDTNLLIDYFEWGTLLWAGESLPNEVSGSHGEELEGLQLIVALWVLRDIRFHVPRFFLRDSKRKPLSHDRLAQRRRAMREFLAAIAVVADAEGSDSPEPRVMHPSDARVLERVPAGNDRLLVEEALRSGVHVFMTRDAGVLAARTALRMLGLVVVSPLDLVEELAAAGALHCLFEPKYLYWPMPDQLRVAHLLKTLRST